MAIQGSNISQLDSKTIYLDTDLLIIGSASGKSENETLLNFRTNYLDNYYGSANIDHNLLINYVANEHIDWTNASNDLSTTGNITIGGDLTVNGAQFISNTETVEITDNLLLINNGEVGAGVTAGIAGVEIDRGTLTNYQFLFDETSDLFKIGESGNLQSVATRPDAVTDNYIARWDNTNNSLKFVEQLDYNTDILNIPDISGFVPYTGANQHVDLETNFLYAQNLRAGLSTTSEYSELQDKTLFLGNSSNNTSSKIIAFTSNLGINAYLKNNSGTGNSDGELEVIAGSFTLNGDTIWNAGNDGSSSGLDADLLDGQHGSYYLDYNNLLNAPTVSDINYWTKSGNDLSYLTGKVGIGITSPSTKLYVYDDTIVSDYVNIAQFRRQYADGSGASAGLLISNNGVGVNGTTRILATGTSTQNLGIGQTGTELFIQKNTGNIGIGNTDLKVWDTTFKALQIGDNAAIMAITSTVPSMNVVSNAYFDGAWKRINENPTSTHRQLNGEHTFRVAGTGTADSLISWTDALHIDNSGNVGVGTPSPTEKLEINGKIKATNINFTNLPTSSTGLSSGDVWNNNGSLDIV